MLLMREFAHTLFDSKLYKWSSDESESESSKKRNCHEYEHFVLHNELLVVINQAH